VEHAESGAAIRGFGVEVWGMRDGKIAVWEAAFNSGRVDQMNSVLRHTLRAALFDKEMTNR
jgi:hypothetical protein